MSSGLAVADFAKGLVYGLDGWKLAVVAGWALIVEAGRRDAVTHPADSALLDEETSA